VSVEDGEPKKKVPERSDALKVDLPFEEAIKAALNTKPPPSAKAKRKPKDKSG
jgi:hypothetical protein